MSKGSTWRLVLFGRTILSFGRSSTKLMFETNVKARFADITADQEARPKLQQIIDLLHSDSVQHVGRCRGVLIVGAPGEDRTLLAKVFAGEARVPFLSISGPDFIDTSPGVAPSQIHDLFELARKRSPCVLLIDDIDVVFAKQGKEGGASEDEIKETRNQLLSEIAGDARKGIVVIATTESLDTIDSSLLRRGWLDQCFRIERDTSGSIVFSCESG